MSVLIASNLRKEFSGDPLFDGVSFTVGRRDRLSLAGPNGAGKTTLLRAIAGETSLQAGELAFAKGTRVALHDQRPPRELGLTLREYVLSGARDLLAVEADLQRLEREMADGAHDEATLRRYSEAQARLEHAGGWTWRDRIAQAARGLGFRNEDFERKLETFSGGELTRASLARSLSVDPDLLLLDEPTNHLDVESLEWLERELETLDAAVILVAHDRWFLEAVTTAVLELSPGGAHYFAGAWHEWRREKVARAAAAGRTADRVSVDIARLEHFVARFRYKKSKAKQAQAKLTQIGRLEKERDEARGELEALTRRRRTLGFDFLQPPRTGRIVLEAEGVALSAGDKPLLTDATIVIERGEKVALVGPNGSGKTTLLEAILGHRDFDEGDATLGHGVVPGYFSQHTQELPQRGSVLDATAAATGLPRPQAQMLLGRFLFSGWETHERAVTALSGGERRRLSLALLVASGSNFLVLDEPTNHLDLVSREALEAALEAFSGTVLIVSHDRALLDAVPDRIVAVEDGTLRSYDGGWADLTRERETPEPTEAPIRERKPRQARPLPNARLPPSSSWSRPASRRWRLGSPTSKASWREIGPTWTSSPPTEPLATSSRGCSRAGRCCSRRPPPGDAAGRRRRRGSMHAVTLDAPRSVDSVAPSFAAVAEELLDDVYGYLLYVTKNWAVAEDLTSETFEAAFRKWRRFDPRRGTPRAWLLAIARTTALDWFRADARRRRREERADAAEPHRDSDAGFGDGLSPALEDGLRALTAGEREVVALRVVLDLDGEETAHLLGITPTAVSTRLSRALAKLEERMREHDVA